MLVLGEAGVGKSRLITEAARFAGSMGLTVVTGQAVEGGGPFRPVVEALLGRHAGSALDRWGGAGGIQQGPALGRAQVAG